MKLQELLRVLLAHSGLTYRKLATLLTKNTNRRYTRDSLYAKVRRGNLKYNEALEIANLLGYDFDLIKLKK